MTIDLLHSRDPDDEILSWLREISAVVNACICTFVRSLLHFGYCVRRHWLINSASSIKITGIK